MLKIATVFSGIGSFEHALDKKGVKYQTVFACDSGEVDLKIEYQQIVKYINDNHLSCEQITQYINSLYADTGKVNFVEATYKANYSISDDAFYQDVRFLNGLRYTGQVDILVGGSPCQSFSISGKRGGLEDARGTLFYDYARLVSETRPKVFIYENVPGMLSHDKGNTWEVISNIFDDLGYSWKKFKLSAIDFGIPQNRTRVFVIGIRKDLNIEVDFDIQTIELQTTMSDYLEKHVQDKYYHGEKGFKWITKPISLKKRVSINRDIARTQTANQQFNWCGDMVFEPISDRKFEDRVYIEDYQGVKGVARKLTPRECLRLMGYSDTFKIVVPDNKMYRQSGNSIVVNVMEAIFDAIDKTGVLDE